MNKTIAVNISGIIFNIEEDAYQLLHGYLEALKSYLSRSLGRDEIIADVEARIAELFSLKVSDKNQVITSLDVSEVIGILGQPEQYMADEEGTEEQDQAGEEEFIRSGIRKRVFRNPDDKLAGGVLSGFAAYFNHDPFWWRLLFAIILLMGFGYPVILYILLWMIIPEARTRAEKLQMRGEEINVENLKRKVEQEARTIKNNLNGLKDGKGGDALRSTIQEIVQFFVNLFALVFRVLGKAFGVLFILFGLGLIAGVLILINVHDERITYVNNGQSHTMGNFQLIELFAGNETDSNLLVYGVAALALAMVITLLTGGLKLLLGQRFSIPRKARLGWITGILAFLGLVSAATAGIRIGTDFSSDEQSESVLKLDSLAADTLIIGLGETAPFSKLSHVRYNYDDFDRLIIKDNHFINGNVRLTIKRAEDSIPQVTVLREASGKNGRTALVRAEAIRYNWKTEGNKLLFDSFFTHDIRHKFRDQKVYITLYLPEGKSVFLREDTRSVIYDIPNVTDTFDPYMPGHVWTMTGRGLESADFTDDKD